MEEMAPAAGANARALAAPSPSAPEGGPPPSRRPLRLRARGAASREGAAARGPRLCRRPCYERLRAGGRQARGPAARPPSSAAPAASLARRVVLPRGSPRGRGSLRPRSPSPRGRGGGRQPMAFVRRAHAMLATDEGYDSRRCMDGSVKVADLAAVVGGDPALFEITAPGIRPARIRAAGSVTAPGVSQELARRPLTAGPPLAGAGACRSDRGKRPQGPAASVSPTGVEHARSGPKLPRGLGRAPEGGPASACRVLRACTGRVRSSPSLRALAALATPALLATPPARRRRRR